jgi:hypothetical protein
MIELIENINEQIEEKVNTMTVVRATDLNLDSRAGYRLYISDDCIVVSKNNDRTLQYYAGFEYINPGCRIELGEYVIYLSEDERVADCLEYYNEVILAHE